MNTRTLETNQQLILENEQALAKQLARLVLEKPVPPIWMIFIPIFFVFHAWRIKGYAKGLDDFVDQLLVSRRRALEAATESVRTGNEVDFEAWMNKAAHMQPAAKPLYRQWMTLLVEQYRTLLTAHG
ncbi:MAG: NF038143 family protein, partial [Desulfobulbus sp.]|nr:NF038143 family protein [Desulfobulbus sp.]